MPTAYSYKMALAKAIAMRDHGAEWRDLDPAGQQEMLKAADEEAAEEYGGVVHVTI